MIPPEKEKEKTLIESFVDSLPYPSYDRDTQFKKMLDLFFSEACMRVNSYDEWHEYLAGHGIILVKARDAREVYKEKWWSWTHGRFSILKNPAERDGCEMMLVPYGTIEKMILLGMLPETSSA